MRIYKLYTNAASSGNNTASVTIAKSGRIQGIRCNALLDTVVDNEGFTCELSLFPASMIAVNDAAGPIAEVSIRNNGTSGGPNYIKSYEAVDVAVGLGEKLYCNVLVAGAPTAGSVTWFIDVEE